MKKSYLFLFLLSMSICLAQNGAPAAPYYNGFNWNQTSSDLKNALATKITSTHVTNLTYSQVWEALRIVDLDPTNSSNVLLVYGWENGTDSDVTNDRARNKFSNGGANGEWNREHIFPQSLGNPDLGQIGPGADAHMLRASDVQRNGSRGNRRFAAGTGISSGVVGTNWYPGDEWKGDCARIIMYMYLRYGNQCLPTFATSGTTNALDANMVDLLLQWNAEDPVSNFEDNRNTYLSNANNTYGQGNRNPFIDNPYLATLIWGGPTAQNRWPAIFLSNDNFTNLNQVSVYPNPTKNNKITIETELVLDEVQLINLNGQLIQVIKRPQIKNSIFDIENIPQGFYILKLNTKEQSIIKKLIVN